MQVKLSSVNNKNWFLNFTKSKKLKKLFKLKIFVKVQKV